MLKPLDSRYIDRLIYEAKREFCSLHPSVIWTLEKVGDHEANIHAKKDGSNIQVRLKVPVKQLIGNDLRILANKIAGFM